MKLKTRVLVVSIWALCAREALAESTSESAAAQGLFDQAKALMAAGKAAEACPMLKESQRLEPASGTLVNLARCYELTGRIASAWSTYLEGASAAGAAGKAERERGAREAATALAPRVAHLKLNVAQAARVAGLLVTKDGTPVGPGQWGVAVPEDEGEHKIAAKAPGSREWTAVVVVKGEGTTVELAVPALEHDVAPAVATPPHVEPAHDQGSARPPASGLGAQRIVALVAGGVGVAGFAVGSVFGLKAISKKSSADPLCDSDGACSQHDGTEAGNDAHAAGNVATVGMIVGAVGVAAGATLWFTAPSHKPKATVGLGLGSLQLRGSW